MAAKTKTTKKTVKKKATFRKTVKSVESIPQEQATVIPNNSFQPIQPIQPVPPIQPVQPIINSDFTQMPVQTAQPVQPVQPIQATPMNVSSQPMPAQPVSPIDGPKIPEAAEPEIKIGTGIDGKSSSTVSSDGKNMDPKPDASQIVAEALKDKSGGKKNLILPIIFIVLLGVAVLGGLFIYRENFTNKVEEKINEVSLSPSPIEKPTTIPVDLSKFTISILNGSGIAGEASNQKSDLESMGFTISAVGNADNSDYAETVIQAKKSVDKAFFDKLKTALEKSFEVTTEVLDEDAETDVTIIIGSNTK